MAWESLTRYKEDDNCKARQKRKLHFDVEHPQGHSYLQW